MSRPRRTTPARRLASVWVAAAAAFAMTACTSPAAPPEAPETSAATGSPLPTYDADATLVPGDPCAGVTTQQVLDAVGAEPDSTIRWAPGERLPGTSEIADEHGCRLTAGDVWAAAWVFAAPTSERQARGLAREMTGGKCRRLRDLDPFGDPGTAFTCGLNVGTSLTGMRGLVGDTWVACDIYGTDDADRVDRWCAAVLASLSTT